MGHVDVNNSAYVRGRDSMDEGGEREGGAFLFQIGFELGLGLGDRFIEV